MTIDEVNARYAIIGIGNRMMVMELAADGSISELWDFEHFRKRLCKEFIKVRQPDGKVKTLPLAEVWLRHPRGRQYNRLVYDMPGSLERANERDFNGWQGFSVAPKPGSWELNRAHLREIICGNDPGAFHWTMNWLAAMIQFPGRHAWTSLVLKGGQGIGKGHFVAKMIGALFGPQQYIHILGAGQLTSDFNEHLSGKVLIFADESTWGGDPRAASKLKGMITEDLQIINRKYLKMVNEHSKVHIVIASNNEWPIPIEPGDRRFTVLDVSEVKKQDQTYFGALLAELDNGGRAAMLHELLSWQVDDKMLRIPYNTAAKTRVAELSMKPIEQWWHELLHRGSILDGTWPDRILKRELHGNYLAFLDMLHRASRDRRVTETELGMFLSKHTTARQQQLTTEGKRERIIWLPPLEECRVTWLRSMNWSQAYPWENNDQQADEPQWSLPAVDPDEM